VEQKPAQADEQLLGVLSAIGAYFCWGLLPAYWKQLSQVPAYEILAHRIVWSFLFMVIIIVATGRVQSFMNQLAEIRKNSRKLWGLVIASALVSINWLVYIWAVNASRVVETSLGYYINPLASVLLGTVVLRERLSLWQSLAFALAAVGVINMTVHFGSVPWVALSLAGSFAFYGMCKKMLGIGAITSITVETMVICPLAIGYLLYLAVQGAGALRLDFAATGGWLIGSGVVTAIPLLLFASSVNRLPLTLIGLFQYLSPTIALLIGVWLYHEPFTRIHLISFSFIWSALAVFSLAKTRILSTPNHGLSIELRHSGKRLSDFIGRCYSFRRY